MRRDLAETAATAAQPGGRRQPGAKKQKLAEQKSAEQESAEQKVGISDGYERDLSVEEAFTFHRDRHAPFGFLVSLSIGGKEILPEFSMFDPTLPGAITLSDTEASVEVAVLPAIGPLSQVSWALGDTDPIHFEARIAAGTKQKVMALEYAKLPALDVAVTWVIYEYDEVQHKYYVAFASPSSSGTVGTPALGQITKNERNLELHVGTSPASEVALPTNYLLSLTINPQSDLQQELYLATGSTLRVIKAWGRIKD